MRDINLVKVIFLLRYENTILRLSHGATTLSIMTLNIKITYLTLGITMLCHNVECSILFIVMLNIVILSGVILNVVMLSVVASQLLM